MLESPMHIEPDKPRGHYESIQKVRADFSPSPAD